MKLTDKERKLLLLAFDPEASVGEGVNAVFALAKSWLTRYPDGHALVKDLESEEQLRVVEKVVYKKPSPYGSAVLGFGIHAGERLDEIPVDYLLWVLENFEDLWPSTRRAIEKYLNQEN